MPAAAAAAALALAVPPLSFAAVRWRRAFVLALPWLVTLNGLAIPVGASSIRVEQIAASLLLLPLAASVLTGRRRLRVDGTAWCLAAILALNIVASVLHSPALGYSLRQCVNLAAAWIIHLLVINLLDTRDEVDVFLRQILLAALAATAIGIAAFALASMGLGVGGAEVSRAAAERFTAAFGAYGTMVEPNIFGSFAASALVLAVTLAVVASQRALALGETLPLRWVIGCAAIGLVLSFTRAAWLGAAFGLAMFAIIGRRRLGVRLPGWRTAAPLGVAIVVVAVLLVAPGDAGGLFRFKLLNLVNVGSQTGLVRVVTYDMALQQSGAHPIIGWGTFSFAPLAAGGADFQQFDNWRNLWIGNFLLLAFHDTGALGLLLWIALPWMALRRGIRAARASAATDVTHATWAVALTVAVASLLIPFLTTSGFSLGYPWILIGALSAHCRFGPRPSHSPAAAPLSPAS